MMDRIKEKTRRVVIKLTVEVLKRANVEIPIKELQKKYGDKGKIATIYVTDINLPMSFRIKNGKVVYVKDVQNPDITIMLNSNTFISLIIGKTKVFNPVTGETEMVDYTPMDAYLRGDVKIFGSGTTVDAFVVFKYIYETIKGTKVYSLTKKLAEALSS